MPTCIHCGTEKDIDLFARRGLEYRGSCKSCHNAQKTAWAKANSGKRADSVHNYYAKSIGKDPEECRLRVPMTAAQRLERKREDYEKHRDAYIQRAKKYAEANKERVAQKLKDWGIKNRDRKIALKKEWLAKNPHKVAHYSNARKARELRATPPWLTDDHKTFMECAYIVRDHLSRLTGILHHVDHIHPLKGRNLCGLNVPWNIRVITAKENQSKGNWRLDEAA